MLNKTYRKRLAIGTKNYYYATSLTIDSTPTGIMIQGGMSGDFSSTVMSACGSIKSINPTLSGSSLTPANCEFR